MNPIKKISIGMDGGMVWIGNWCTRIPTFLLKQQKFWGMTTEFVGHIPRNPVLWIVIVLG